MRSLSSIANCRANGFSCATSFLAPLLVSTRTSWPSAVSTTKRLPFESKLTAAGNLEAFGDHGKLGLVDVDPPDLALEP